MSVPYGFKARYWLARALPLRVVARGFLREIKHHNLLGLKLLSKASFLFGRIME